MTSKNWYYLFSLLIVAVRVTGQPKKRPLFLQVETANTYNITARDTIGAWFGIYAIHSEMGAFDVQSVTPQFRKVGHEGKAEIWSVIADITHPPRFDTSDYQTQPLFLCTEVRGLRPGKVEGEFGSGDGQPSGDPPNGGGSRFESLDTIIVKGMPLVIRERGRTTTVGDDWLWKDLTTSIEIGGHEQNLEKTGTIMYAGGVYWVGDLDHDGKPDIIFIPSTDNPQDCSEQLYLSSLARGRELVHLAAASRCIVKN